MRLDTTAAHLGGAVEGAASAHCHTVISGFCVDVINGRSFDRIPCRELRLEHSVEGKTLVVVVLLTCDTAALTCTRFHWSRMDKYLWFSGRTLQGRRPVSTGSA